MLRITWRQNSETFTAITRIRLCTVSVLVYANKFLKILKKNECLILFAGSYCNSQWIQLEKNDQILTAITVLRRQKIAVLQSLKIKAAFTNHSSQCAILNMLVRTSPRILQKKCQKLMMYIRWCVVRCVLHNEFPYFFCFILNRNFSRKTIAQTLNESIGQYHFLLLQATRILQVMLLVDD